MRSYFLETERIGFSIWTREDNLLAEQLWGNPRVTKLICATGVFTKEDITNRLETELKNMETHSIQYWPIFQKETGNFIGCCGLRPYKPEENIAEIGFHLLPQFWGKGYATESAKAVMKYAFSQLGIKAIFSGHNPKNQASANTLKKLEFQYTHDEFYPATGLMHPSYLYRPKEEK